jgi:TolA-binding protein
VCVLLGLGLAIAGHPEVFWAVAERALPGSYEGTPILPADLLLRTADAAHARGNYEASAQLNALLVTQHPQHPLAEEALIARVQALSTLEQRDAMRDAVEELRVMFPRSEKLPSMLAELGRRYFVNADYTEAARCYTDLIGLVTRYERAEIFPDDREQQLGPAMRRARHNEKLARLARRTELERLARFNLALCHDRSGKRRAALRSYERFVRRFPTDARSSEAWFRMGTLELESRHIDVAAEHFGKVYSTSVAPSEYRAASIYKAGRCLERLRRRDAARETYKLTLEMQPSDDPWRLASLTRLAALLRDPEPLRALEVYRDLAENSTHSVRRAVARQNLVELQAESAMAAVAR